MGPHDFELQSVATLTDDPNRELDRPQQLSSLAKDQQVLRYRRRSLWIFIVYLPILVVPWVITCILMNRPINKSSYTDPAGSITPRDVYLWNRWRIASRTLTAITGVIGIPIVSCLLAHGAVVYSQRRSAGQKLSVLQLFSLADRKWLNPGYLLMPHVQAKSWGGSLYLLLATLLIILTAVQPSIQAILVRDESIKAVTCQGHPGFDSGYYGTICKHPYEDRNTKVIAQDSEPIGLKFCPQSSVVRKTRQKLISSTRSDIQPRLWPDDTYYNPRFPNYLIEKRRTLDWYYQKPYDGNYVVKRPYYASPVVNGTSTGVYRHHAIRMDSTAKCYNEIDFPRNCKGDKPFTTSFSDGWLNIDICVEGRYDAVPWNTTRNKQELTENLWLSVNWDIPEEDENWGYRRVSSRYVTRCESVSRRGWFELPSDANSAKPGPLLDEWPSQQTLTRDFNDYYIGQPSLGLQYETRFPTADLSDEDVKKERYRAPSIDDSGSYDRRSPPVPGPLMTAALALFGNASFFHAASVADKSYHNQTMANMCDQSLLPLIELMPIGEYGDECENLKSEYSRIPMMEEFIVRYFERFENVNATEHVLEMAMFFANEALLTTSAERYVSRPILFSPGTEVTKPKKDMGALIAVSVLIGLQVVGLCVLMCFILHKPTWTQTLDADALAQIGGQLKEWGEPRPDLAQINGVVGVDATRSNAETSSVETPTMEALTGHATDPCRSKKHNANLKLFDERSPV
ncbi:hypothetical protein F53441_6264 [Fusarium austroafricanum]|uniref:Uncharacterized protein n=1 Tax=Fusarium austroafricanum TaxID=2364996 RepID=A0A8H4NYT0_9HYPO|nr:hypothetical protein F53441_6264 [Fusarium austroafricanum]